MTIPERIKELRENLKITQQEMADRTDISKSFIGTVESGKQSISYDFLIKFCTTFNVSADWLIFGKGNMFSENNEFLSTLDENWIATLKIIESWDIDLKLTFFKLVLAAMEAVEEAQKKI
jgi:transcriptional regulator with XRE-family HTH domain